MNDLGVKVAFVTSERLYDDQRADIADVFGCRVANGYGGRDAGFIAAGATLASQEVNFVLIPEVPFALDGPGGLMAALKERIERRRHALVVVAEGAGQDLCRDDNGQDLSGNPILGATLTLRYTGYGDDASGLPYVGLYAYGYAGGQVLLPRASLNDMTALAIFAPSAITAAPHGSATSAPCKALSTARSGSPAPVAWALRTLTPPSNPRTTEMTATLVTAAMMTTSS